MLNFSHIVVELLRCPAERIEAGLPAVWRLQQLEHRV
jgi:hypothetical protein